MAHVAVPLLEVAGDDGSGVGRGDTYGDAVEVVVEDGDGELPGADGSSSEGEEGGRQAPSDVSFAGDETPRGGGVPHFADVDVMVIENDRWKSWIPLSALACLSVVVGLAVAFSLPSDEQWLVRYTIGIVLLVNAAVMCFNAKSEQYVFDSTAGKLIITTRRVVGTTVRQYWLYEIRDVQVQEYFDPQGGTDYELYLYIRSGSRVKLFSGHIIGVGWQKKMRTREEIKAFLNAFSKRYRARSSASHSSFRHYLKRRHFTSSQSLLSLQSNALASARTSLSSPYSSPARSRPGAY